VAKSRNGCGDWNEWIDRNGIQRDAFSSVVSNGLFFSMGSWLMVSSDGVNYENATLPTGLVVNDICFSMKLGFWLAVGSGNQTNMAKSHDGMLWTEIPVSSTWLVDGVIAELTVCSFSDELGLFVAGAQKFYPSLGYSKDGWTWLPSLGAANVGNVRLISFKE
jgi:hypothetical protein